MSLLKLGQTGFMELLKQSAEKHLNRNLELFLKHILNLDIQTHEREWYRRLVSYDRLLLLAPREHGKTTIVGYAYPLWQLCREPNARVLYMTKSDNKAVELVGRIKRTIESNENFQKYYGNIANQKDQWTQHKLYIKRTANHSEPSFLGIGLKGDITGRHFEYIVLDDLFEDEDVRSEVGRKFIEERFRGTILGLTTPLTQIIIIGTAKHWADLYQTLLSDPMWQGYVDRAIAKMPEYSYVKNQEGKIVGVEVKGDSQVLWQAKWDIKTLLLKKAEQGEVYFEREYQNNPASMKGQTLKAEWLQYYDKVPENARRLQMWDLAISENPEADYTVCVTLARDSSNTLYVEDVFRAHLDFPSQCRAITTKFQQHHPVVVGIESNAYQRALAQWVKENTLIPIREVHQHRNKVERITALGPQFENGRIKIHKSQQDFLKEYLEFPSGAHDDQLDALEGAVQLAGEYDSSRPIVRSIE